MSGVDVWYFACTLYVTECHEMKKYQILKSHLIFQKGKFREKF